MRHISAGHSKPNPFPEPVHPIIPRFSCAELDPCIGKRRSEPAHVEGSTYHSGLRLLGMPYGSTGESDGVGVSGLSDALLPSYISRSCRPAAGERT